MTHRQWLTINDSGAQQAETLYVQAWALAHFCLFADDGRYARPFIQFITLASQGAHPGKAFVEAFGITDVPAFEHRWRRYVLAMSPDVSKEELLEISRSHRAAGSTLKPQTLLYFPQGWKDRGIGNPVRVTVIPKNPKLPPDVVAFGPRYTIRLLWTFDDDGRPQQEFIYE
jgi:hypothetical protein